MDKVLKKLKSLNIPVPIPLVLPSVQEIEEVQKDLGVEFHSTYVKYLLEASDVVFGTLEPATVPVHSGHTYIGKVATEAWKMGVSRELVPIAEDNGDYYCMNREGEVLFWSHNGVTDEKWSSLGLWIESVWINGG